MNFKDKLKYKGRLQILKDYGDREEIVFEDHNIIVSGMGTALSHLFVGDGSHNFQDFKIDSFQLGVSGGENAHVESTNELSGALLSKQEYSVIPAYFQDNLLIGSEIGGEFIKTDQVFGKLKDSKITKAPFSHEVSGPAVMFKIIIDKNTANEIIRDGKKVPLNEIGLFMKNPHFNIPFVIAGENRPLTIYNEGKSSARVLVAYRYFSNILKDKSFGLIFKWVVYMGV